MIVYKVQCTGQQVIVLRDRDGKETTLSLGEVQNLLIDLQQALRMW